MLNITTDDLNRLKNFAQDKGTLEALKKFFLVHAINKRETEVHALAASRLAIDILATTFRNLENIEVPEEVKRPGNIAL